MLLITLGNICKETTKQQLIGPLHAAVSGNLPHGDRRSALRLLRRVCSSPDEYRASCLLGNPMNREAIKVR